MGASGVISAMKKSYADNRALLRHKGTFECMKDYYVANPTVHKNRGTNYDALKQWRIQRTRQRSQARWMALTVALGLLFLPLTLCYAFYG